MTHTELRPLSLYDRLGGQAAVDAAVEVFYEKALADPILRPFLDGVDMKAQKGKRRAFLTLAFGGPTNDTGQDLRSAHAPLVARGPSPFGSRRHSGHRTGRPT